MVPIGTLTFTTANWNTPQTVSVTGADNAIASGDQIATIAHRATSQDPDYQEADVASVMVTIEDNDMAGVTIFGVSQGEITVAEDGATADYTVALNSQPTGNVEITVTSSATSIATVSPATLTFTPDDWRDEQTVRVTGADNAVDSGDQTATISQG